MAGYEIGSLVWKITGDTSGIKKSLSETENSVKNTTSNGMSMFQKFGIAIGAAGIAKGIYEIAKASLAASAQMEQQNVAFTTMLGSAALARSLLKDLAEFAAATPFQMTELVDASKRMIAFGFSAQEVIPKLKQVGDVAAGLSQPIGDMIYLYGQIKTQGRAMTQDLMQFANRGIPIYEELAKVLKISTNQVKEYAEKGKIGFKEIEDVFANMTKEGGKFAGLMDAQSQTLSGQWSNFKDNLERIAVSLGDKLAPKAKGALDILNRLTESDTASLKRGIGDLISKTEEYIAANGENADIMKDQSSWLAYDVKMIEKQKGIQIPINATAKERLEIYKKLSTLSEFEAQAMGLLASNASSVTDLINKGMDFVAKSADKASQNNKKVTQSMTSDQKKFIEERKKAEEDYNKFVNTALGFETANLDAELAERTAAVNKYFKNKEDKIVAIATLEAIYSNKKKDKEWDAVIEQVDALNMYVSSGVGAFNTLASAFDAYIQARLQSDIDALDAQLEAELEAAGVSEETTVEQAQREYDAAVETGDALAIEEKRRALVKAQIEEKYQKKKADLEYQAALIAWQFQMATAAAQIPLATMNAIASGFKAPSYMLPWFPIAMGAVAATATTMQLAAVAESKPQPPKFAAGGIIPGSAQGTNIIAGENNRTEVVMNPDQMANTLMAIGNGRGGGGVTLAQMPPVSEAAFYKMIFDASQNGDLYIAQRAVTNK